MKIVRKDISGYSIYDSNAFDQEIIDEMLSNGFKELHETEPPTDYNEETMELKQEIVEREDGDYEYKYTAVISKTKIEQSISLLKQQLADTDYKVVKNMEYQMAMMSSIEPNQIILDLYDPQELHNERQALRDKINELENLLKTN
jgi:hypothetical protein